MSFYYSPEIVKLLAAERLREAQEARRASDLRRDPRLIDRPSRFTAAIGRIFATRSSRPGPASCTSAC